MKNWKWFDLTKDTNLQGTDPEIISLLDVARQKTVEVDPDGKGTPFVITSGRRSVDENAALKDSASRSSHIPRPPGEYSTGVDIACNDGRSMAFIVIGLVLAGFRRFGLYYRKEGANCIPTHVHADKTDDLPTPALWITEER